MRLGVKMCGNCNPDIESMKCAKRIAQALGMDLVRYDEGDITLTVSGRIDTITAPKLIEAFELRMKDPVAKSLSVDMSGCAYISSAGLRAMMMMYKHMKKTGGEFFIKNLRPEVYEIISVTGFSDFM